MKIWALLFLLTVPSMAQVSNPGVTQIVAGTNVTLNPSGGTGVVTVNASGGGGGGGTVTSVSFTGDGTVLSSTPSSAVTSSGTLLAVLNTAAANYFLSGPTSGSATLPTYRLIVAADVPTLNQNTTGTAGNITATSNSTLTSLSALSLPYSQLTGTPTVPTSSSWPNAGTCTTGQYVNALTNGAIPTCAVVQYSQLGGTNPLLSAANTWSAANTFSGGITSSGITSTSMGSGALAVTSTTGGIVVTNSVAAPSNGLLMKTTTSATSGACSTAPPIQLGGTYYNGSASVGNVISATNTCVTGANGAETLTIANTLGSTGAFHMVFGGGTSSYTDLTVNGGLVELSIPVGTATFAAGSGVTSVACASGYACNNTRGTLTIVGGTATTGTIATVSFSAALSAAPQCFVSQNGGTSLFGIGNGAPSTTAFTITAGITVLGQTLTVNYQCQP
jgi:hypothetical protein